MAMSLFGRKKPDDPIRDYDSWDPAVRARKQEDAAAAAGAEGAATKSGRSRTGAEHLQAATDALDAQAKRDA
jgi:hypothetical protein